MGKIIATIAVLIGVSAVVSVVFLLITKSPRFLTYNNYVLMGLAAYISFAFLQFALFRNFFLNDHELVYLGLVLFLAFFGIALVQTGVFVWAFFKSQPFPRKEFYIFLGIIAFLVVSLTIYWKNIQH